MTTSNTAGSRCPSPSRRNVLAVGGATLGAAALGLAAPQAASASSRRHVPGNPPTDSRVDFRRWTYQHDFRRGRGEGIRVLPGDRTGVVISEPVGVTAYHDPYLKTTREYSYSVWTSEVHRLHFAGNQLTTHWDARAPEGTFLKMEMRAIMQDGHSEWWTMGIWAYHDAELRRTSVNNQTSGYGEVDTDTWNARGHHRMHAYQLRLTLYRRPRLQVSTRVWQLGAIASYVPMNRRTVPPGPPGPATGITLPVAPYAQNPHSGQYPRYGGGGEAWCSPTSTEMVVRYWGHGPSKRDMAGVDPAYSDPQVDYAARYTYDWGYQGTGNWPFNTAYASRYGLDGMVTRLNSLWELEVLVAHGFPVITSQAFTKKEMGYYTSAGHLWVVIGFTADGKGVIVNDPASDSDSNVYTVYDRREFEIVWLRVEGPPAPSSGGVAYIIKPHHRRLPKVVDPRSPSWPSGQA